MYRLTQLLAWQGKGVGKRNRRGKRERRLRHKREVQSTQQQSFSETDMCYTAYTVS
jgi:hypothetical protein